MIIRTKAAAIIFEQGDLVKFKIASGHGKPNNEWIDELRTKHGPGPFLVEAVREGSIVLAGVGEVPSWMIESQLVFTVEIPAPIFDGQSITIEPLAIAHYKG
ncbi:MAG: hypothetical protein V4480_01180 [Patescibacteria group bacterium]